MTRLRRVTCTAALAAMAVLWAAAPASAAEQPPYKDPASVGAITLCDAKGNAVTQGDTRDLPFAFFAISSQAAKGPYAVKQGKATLYAFQPRKDVDPGDWSGLQLSGSSFYSTTAHPMVEITTGDKTLSQDVATFPSQWSGFVQLRMYLAAPNQVQYSDTYPTVNLKITGTRWVAADAGTTSCKAGQARSTEKLILPAASFPKPSTARSSPASSSPSASRSSTPGGTDGSDTVAAGSGGDESPAADAGSNRSTPILLGLLLVAMVGVAVAAWTLARSRRREPSSPNG